MAEEFIYTTPEFLRNQTEELIHARMMETLPADIDKSEGQFPWDFTYPTAMEKAYFIGQQLNEAIKLIFPMFANSEWLDMHASNRGIYRKTAVQAMGVVTITGDAGTTIKKGFRLSTEAVNGEQAVEFETIVLAEIPESGSVEIPVQAVEAGITGNVGENTITVMVEPIKGIQSITNAEETSGGIPEETDDDLRLRVVEYDRTQGYSFVGSKADYRRWAMSVPGVGAANIIAANDDSGLVTIIITDALGEPANLQLCEDVYNYIMRPDNEMERLAPVNAYLSVVAPETITVKINAKVELVDISMEAAKESFVLALKTYFNTAIEENEIKYTRVCACLTDVPGVNDFKELTINGGTSNIAIAFNQLPDIEVDGITFTEAVV